MGIHSRTFVKIFSTSTAQRRDSKKPSPAGLVTTSVDAWRTAMGLCYMLWRPGNMTRSKGALFSFTMARNWMPRGFSGNSYFRVLCNTSQKNILSQQPKKTCSTIFCFLHKKQWSPLSTDIALSTKHVLTGRVPVCCLKKKRIDARLDGHSFDTLQDTFHRACGIQSFMQWNQQGNINKIVVLFFC